MIHGWSALGGLTMAGWEGELERWLMPFLERLGHKARQRMCPLYVAGLIGPGDRKSVAPMRTRVAGFNGTLQYAERGAVVAKRIGVVTAMALAHSILGSSLLHLGDLVRLE